MQPTAVQSQAWKSISQGDHTLVVAPTGSGKTLAAFLWSLSKLAAEPATGTRVLYISPLKALGVDVDRNLAAPLAGIARTAEALGEEIAPVRVGVRSGDTPARERAKLIRTPPEILITTPESLYLMLTSKAAGTLTGVDTVIVDEVHAVADSKRGTHLALSLERLDQITEQPVQRIGLSATVNPIDTVASFLAGDRPITVVNPPMPKRWDVKVRSVVEDFQDPPAEENLMESALPQKKSVWPFVQESIYQQVMENHSTLVFVNSRRAAERLTGALNERWAEEHDPDSLAAPTRRDPAQLMAQSTTITGSPAVIARAHHGSVSKDERAEIEQALKSGQLKCVVATSSLELGIDMGLVDHVIQVGAPPSVASAVQRCGRSGHTVGAVSAATIYPLHKQDAEAATVIVDRMLKGELEPLRVVKNALDVLAQHTVAAAARGTLDVEQWWSTVRRAYPYATLHRDAFDGVIALISGYYPSTDFADLKPRVVYDPVAGTLEPRPNAQRIAVTTGGTIPDRGMFGVFLAGEETGARRVGELDEEMVYESRVGDVFTLGASSWRILEITRDQVIVAPAAGHTGRLPFWTGDAEGRPVELGIAIGEYRRHATRYDFIDENTAKNLASFYQQQRETAGIIPDEKTILLERFQDDLGDWRVVIHSPFGRGVNAPWAMALAAEIQRTTGIDSMAVAGDDGLVLRLPHTDEPPMLVEAHADDVLDNVGSSALFASRFRECAARALLLPRKPGKRQPLWQQRQRAAQLLDVAREHPDFPIMVETMRECLHDVYHMEAFQHVLEQLGDGIRVAEVTTNAPSAFAESLLFTYSGAFMYEGDSAERAAALAVDSVLLAKVLGTSQQGIELDPAVVERVVAAAQWLADGRRATSMEQVVDMLRSLGPLTRAQIAQRSEVEFDESFIPRRLAEIHYGGTSKIAVVEDMALLRDGLGVPVPPGVAADPELQKDALRQLLHRWMRHRGPTTAGEAAAEFGIGAATADSLLSDLEPIGQAYIDKAMLRRLRSATLAAARGALEPVSQEAYVNFLQTWHGIGQQGDLFNVIDQLAGVPIPTAEWESLIFPARLDYQPSELDELMGSGEVVAIGGPGTVTLLPADLAAYLPEVDVTLSEGAQQALERMQGGGAFLARELGVSTELWELFEAGLITPDSFMPLRAGKPKPRIRRRRVRQRIRSEVPGRWASIKRDIDITPEERAAVQGEAWIERYGVVTRGSIVAEKASGGFAQAYRLLSKWEDTGAVLRGYVIEGLGGAQFAPREVLAQLRKEHPEKVVVLAASDPANAFGSALAWPKSAGTPARKAGARVVLRGGELLAYVSKGAVLMFSDDVEAVVGALRGMVVEKIDGVPVLEADVRQWKAAGARLVPKGLSLK